MTTVVWEPTDLPNLGDLLKRLHRIDCDTWGDPSDWIDPSVYAADLEEDEGE